MRDTVYTVTGQYAAANFGPKFHIRKHPVLDPCGGKSCHWQIQHINQVALSQRDGSLDHIAEFSDVVWPCIVAKNSIADCGVQLDEE